MKVRLNDIWLRIIGIPLLAFVGAIIAHYYFLMLTFLVSLIWHTNRLIHLRVRKHYEQFNRKDKIVKGWLVRLLLYGSSTIILIFSATLIFDQSATSFTILVFQFLQPVSFALLFSYLIAGFYETRYFIFEWDRSFTEAEGLKKLNLQIQVDSLRNQINPHFLFFLLQGQKLTCHKAWTLTARLFIPKQKRTCCNLSIKMKYYSGKKNPVIIFTS